MPDQQQVQSPVLRQLLLDPEFHKLRGSEQFRVFKEVATVYDPDFANLTDEEKQRVAMSVLVTKPFAGGKPLGTMIPGDPEPGWLRWGKLPYDIGMMGTGARIGGEFGGPLGAIIGAGAGLVGADIMERGVERSAGFNAPQFPTNQEAGETFASGALGEGAGRTIIPAIGKGFLRTGQAEEVFDLTKEIGGISKGITSALQKPPDYGAKAMREVRSTLPEIRNRIASTLGEARTDIIGPPESSEVTSRSITDVRQTLSDIVRHPSGEAGSLFNKITAYNNSLPKSFGRGAPPPTMGELSGMWDAIEYLQYGGKLSQAEEGMAVNLQRSVANAMDSYLTEGNKRALADINAQMSDLLRYFDPSLTAKLNKAKTLEEAADVYFSHPATAIQLIRNSRPAQKQLLQDMFIAKFYDSGKNNLGRMAKFLSDNASVVQALGLPKATEILAAEKNLYAIEQSLTSPVLKRAFLWGMRDAMKVAGNKAPDEAALRELASETGPKGFWVYLRHRMVFHMIFTGGGALAHPMWWAEGALVGMDLMRYQALKNPAFREMWWSLARPGSNFRNIGYMFGKALSYALASGAKQQMVSHEPDARPGKVPDESIPEYPSPNG